MPDPWRDDSVDSDDFESKKNVKENDNDFNYFDDIKEPDIPIGFDLESEKRFVKKKLRAGFTLSPKQNLPGKEFILRGSISTRLKDEMLEQDRRLSERTEERLNKRLFGSNKKKIGVGIKDWQPFYHAYDQIRDKYYHAWVLDKNLPDGLSKTKLKKIQEKPYKELARQKAN